MTKIVYVGICEFDIRFVGAQHLGSGSSVPYREIARTIINQGE
jgi:hypothetical protein